MKVKLLILLIIILSTTLFAKRSIHYAISDPVNINTVVGNIGYAVSEPVPINTNVLEYSSYRIVELSQAPNPSILEIPESGIGYAWFVVEGELDGVWLPIPNIDIQAEDGQGNIIQCQANTLPYQFLTSPYHFQNESVFGVFGVPIDADIIGYGSPGYQETITVTTANGEPISPSNQQSIIAKVIPYQYSASWGYRLYAKGGIGLTAGVATAIGFVGGGSGSTIKLKMEGLSSNPSYSQLTILRRGDLFTGLNARLEPPSLIGVNMSASMGVTATFPYQNEYEFDLNNMNGVESASALYLFMEPSIIFASGAIPGGQIAVNFLGWLGESIIVNDGQDYINNARIADETGLDIEGNANVAVGLGIGITKSLELSMGPNLGIHAHLGGSIRSSVDNKIQNRLYISGGYNESIGPKLIGNNFNFKFLIPYRFNNSFIPNTLNVGYQYLETFQNEEIESINFSTSLASNSSLLNIYNLPGETQKYKSWLSTDEESIRNTILYNELANRTNDIGSNSTNINLSNASFKDEYESILDEFYEEQNNSLPSKLQYGLCVEDRNEISIDFNLEFSIPFLPPIVINVGGGIEASDAREYNLSKGYWVKGLPYLQTEMPNPHVPQTTLSDIIIGELWGIIITEFKTNLQNVISQYWRSIRLFFHFDRTGDYQIIELNDRGSTLQIKEESIPATIDSAYCRNWEWGEEPESLTLTKQQKQKIKEFNIQLRMIREEALGLHYGIGGFFNFEPEGEVFGDSTLLSIAYADSEITGLNEDHLAIYWEDSEGFWNPISAIVYPDSNLVKAWITDFQTYTIAPRLPQGSFNLNSNPDSLAADGVSIAQITSEALYNNDGTIIEDGSLFTVQTSRGSIITTDEDVEIAGVQVYVSAGTIQFEVQSDSISVPITLTAYSIQGFATCEMDLDFYDVSFPETPVLLSIVPEHNALRLSWQDVNIPDLAGYKIYYDIDESGAPYNGTANYLGTNSPVIVGNVNEHLLTGLSNNETYFVSITAFDVSDVESSYSNELTDSPELQSVSIISTEMLQDGFKLSWNPVFGANSYNIYRSTNPYADISEMEIVQQTTSTNWTDIDIIVENQYFYRIVVVAY